MEMLMERMPGKLTWICTFLAVVIPYIVYKINEKIHLKMDPPWRQEERQDGQNCNNNG